MISYAQFGKLTAVNIWTFMISWPNSTSTDHVMQKFMQFTQQPLFT